MSFQTSELEALEARLRATEERLKKAASAGASPAGHSSSGRSSPRHRSALGDIFAPKPTKEDNPTSPLASEYKDTLRPNTSDRPEAGKCDRPVSGSKHERHPSHIAPPMPGALPPTPGASEGDSDSEYVVVEVERKRADFGKDGDMPPLPLEK